MMNIVQVREFLHVLKPALLMAVSQVALAGGNVMYKLAANDGMSTRVVIAYRFILSTSFTIPLAIGFERKNMPKLTWTILFQGFLCALFGGSLLQNLYAESLVLTTATFTSAMYNLSPAITFILAIPFGMEKLGLRSTAGKAKLAGTLMGIGGAMLLCFYKGPQINISTHVNLLHRGRGNGEHVVSSHSNHAMGTLLAVLSCFSNAIYLIIQSKMSVRFPCPFSSTALLTVMGSFQATIYAICIERDWSQWKLGWNIRLLVAIYMGIVASVLVILIFSWCVQMRGPLYVSVFSPLQLVVVTLAGSLLLKEELHLGCILGAIMIICSLYLVLWGKAKEVKKVNQHVSSEDSLEAEIIEVDFSPPIEHACQNDSNNNNTTLKNYSEEEYNVEKIEEHAIEDKIEEECNVDKIEEHAIEDKIEEEYNVDKI